MICLNTEEKNFILEKFEHMQEKSASYTHIWNKRLYAPMFIHSNELLSIKKCITEKYPEYTITFDVVFSSKGNKVDWHTDYESLGPFYNNTPLEGIYKQHFLSIHFNLTDGGGHLQTMNSPILSYFNYLIIIHFGIFSLAHRIFSLIIRPFVFLFLHEYSNKKQLGNAFNNLELHAVSSGKERISYVIRMAKSSHVTTSKSCITKAIQRSENSAEFVKLMHVVPTTPTHVSQIRWDKVEQYGAETSKTSEIF